MKRTIRGYFHPSSSDSRENAEEIRNDESMEIQNLECDSDSDDFNAVEFIRTNADHQIGKYENLLRQNKNAKSVAKIVLTERKGTGSEVWNYFGVLFLGKSSALNKSRFCKLCFEMELTTLKGFSVGTSTSNLITHLRSVHDIEIKTKTSGPNLQITNKALAGSSSNIFRNKGEAKFVNARRIAEMCCTDLQPFNIVERPGFRKYISQLKPDLEIPRSRTVATTALQDVYQVYMKIVKEKLLSAPGNISLVLDLWTDNYKHLSYINIKVHYCLKFTMISASLKTEYFAHPHTGIRIADTIISTLKEFNLEERRIHAISDGGSNIISGVKLAHIVRYECMAHALHRFLVNDVLENPQFNSIKNVVKKLKTVFRKLSYTTENIAMIQRAYHQEEVINILTEISDIVECLDLEEEYGTYPPDHIDSNLLNALEQKQPTSLKNSNDTRWNTLLAMFRSFSKNFDTVNIALIQSGREAYIFQEVEKQVIKEFTAFLTIFEKATIYLQGRNYPTLCSIIFFYENIIKDMATNEQVAEFGSSISIYEFAATNFKKRFKIRKIHLIAAFMDPCQRNWPQLQKWLQKIPKDNHMALNEELIEEYPDESCISKEELIYQELIQLSNISPEKRMVSDEVIEPEPATKKLNLSATRKSMLEFMASTSSQEDDGDLRKEIQSYFNAPHEETECLDWWRQKEQIFPRLSKLADFCFGIPATSASSEEAFSVAGACITAKRSRLNPCTVKRQLFVHDNQHLVEPILKNQ